MKRYTGGCLCGAIRYEIKSEPVRVAMCHCGDCRKATGASFATNVFFKADDIVLLKGQPKRFSHESDSGATMTKEFCGDCGSQLFGSGSRNTGTKNVKAGTIDDVGNIRPQIELFTSRALPFTRHLDDTEHFELGRPR